MNRALCRVLLLAFLLPTTAAGQDSALVAALWQNRHTLHPDPAGGLKGPGARVLLDGGRDAQFFLIGEDHGIAQVPQLAAALFRELAPAGYRYLAVETGEALAAALNRAARGGDTAIAAFVDRYWPGAPFYGTREEAELLVAATAAAGGKEDVVWGLDYDIFGDRYALRRLREIAPTPGARAAADRTIAFADSMLRAAIEAGNLAGIAMFAGPDTLFPALRRAYAPVPGSEADRILDELEATVRINHLYLARRGYHSNVERGRVMKTRFMRRYREAVASGDTLPRVMLKFGANHAIRGRSFVDFFDLGTAVHELAELNGGKAFGVMVLPGRGTSQAIPDPRTFGYTPRPIAEGEWARPLYDLADARAWTLFDLRPLRQPLSAGRLGTVPPRLARVIYGFDALVILSGSGPATPLAEPPPSR